MFENIFMEFMSSIADGALALFVQLLGMFQSKAVVVFNLPFVQQVVKAIQFVLISFFSVKIMYEIIMIYFLRKNGDKNFSVSDWSFRMVYGVFLIVFLPTITMYIWSFGMDLASGLDVMGINTLEAGKSYAYELGTMVSDVLLGGFYIVLMIIASVILFLIIMFQSYIRSIELVVFLFVGMFTAVGLSSNADAMTPWYKKIIGLSLAQATVVFLIKLMFAVLASTISANTLNGLDRLMLGISCLWVTVFVPSSIEQFIGSTGMHKTIDTAAKFKDNINKIMKLKK